MSRFIDNSPAQSDTPHENGYRAPLPEVCGECGVDVTQYEGWCRCVEDADRTPPWDDDDYPEGHSPYCHHSCDHPCHDRYDRWVAEKRDKGGW